MQIVLASSSKTRAKLLRDAGVAISVRPAAVDEPAIRAALEAEGAAPHDIADTIAEYKARRAAVKVDGQPVLGCDQILSIDGSILSKPESRADAAAQLHRLQGRAHRLVSAAVLYQGMEPTWRAIGQARLTVHAMTEVEIENYLAIAWPTVEGSLGAYHAEGFGVRLFSQIDGDWFSVLGLPLLQILSQFRRKGWLT